jgi:hypothetical protein
VNTYVATLDERRLNSENSANPFTCEYFERRAAGDDTRFIQQHDVIGKASRQIEIVYDAHRDDIRRSRKLFYLFHEIDLVADVQKREWLVEKKITRWTIVL